MLATNLAEKDLYLNKSISYLKNVKITEYDMKTAGFNIIRELKLLNQEKINELEQMEKKDRTIAIGKIMKSSPEFSKNLTEGFRTFRKKFIELNNIDEEDILSIKKDAIFIIQKTPNVLNVGEFVKFVPKNTYTSYVYINGVEMYYDSYTKKLDVKNLKLDYNVELQYAKGEKFDDDIENFQIFKDFKKMIQLSEKLPSEELFNYFKNYRKKYLEKKLPIETYREVSTGLFSIDNSTIQTKFIDDVDIDFLDISRNFIEFLIPFFQVLL